MFAADKGAADRLDGKALVIGIVQARFNQGVTNALAKACWGALLEHGVQEKNIDHVQVPGALEVPVALQALDRTIEDVWQELVDDGMADELAAMTHWWRWAA